MFPGVLYALLAGFLGAVASSSAKLSLGTDYLKGVCETGLRTWGEQRRFAQHNDTSACDWVSECASRVKTATVTSGFKQHSRLAVFWDEDDAVT